MLKNYDFFEQVISWATRKSNILLITDQVKFESKSRFVIYSFTCKQISIKLNHCISINCRLLLLSLDSYRQQKAYIYNKYKKIKYLQFVEQADVSNDTMESIFPFHFILFNLHLLYLFFRFFPSFYFISCIFPSSFYMGLFLNSCLEFVSHFCVSTFFYILFQFSSYSTIIHNLKKSLYRHLMQ